MEFSSLFYRDYTALEGSHFGGDDAPDMTVAVSENLCDTSKGDTKLEPNGDLESIDIETVHRIKFKTAGNDTDGDDIGTSSGVGRNASVCVHSCFPEWIDPFLPEDSPLLLEKPSRTEQELERARSTYIKTTKQLFGQLVVGDDNLFDDDEDIQKDEKEAANVSPKSLPDILGNNIEGIKGKYPNLIKLLAQTLRIAMLKCSPFVESRYMFQVLRVMIFFYETNEHYDMLDVDPSTFKKMMKPLKECENSPLLQIKLNGTQCGNQHTLDSIIITDPTNGTERVWRYRRLARSFRWGILDPAVESAWAAVDFVHGLCFQSFYASGSVLYFHLYMTAMETFFPPEPVQSHWMNPVKLKSDSDFWNSIMDTNDIVNQVRNLDGCATSAYLANLSPYKDRLLRPFVKEEQVINPTYEEFTPAGPGWRKSSSEYWSWYESVGGFKEISKNFGYCLDGSRENVKEAKRKVAESCRREN